MFLIAIRQPRTAIRIKKIMYYRFEKLNVWIEARSFVKSVYQILDSFPSSEKRILIDQIKRAAVSIVLNIAEGSDKNSDKDFIRYLRISLGSINEVVAALFIAKDLCYINEESFILMYEKTHKLSAMINAFIRKINEK